MRNLKIERFNTFNTKKSLEKITEEYGNKYEIISKRRRLRYSLPFKIEREYIFKIKVDEKEINRMNFTRKLLDLKEERQKKDLKLLKELETKRTAIDLLVEEENSVLSREEREMMDLLVGQGVHKEIVESWFEEFDNLNRDELTLKEKVSDKIKRVVKSGSDIENDKVVVFFGPTGVGKTTTIVKLVNSFKEQETHVVTTDDNRMGAYVEMEMYAKKYNFPMTKSDINERIDINEILVDQTKRILIDTSGVNPNYDPRRREYIKFYNYLDPDQKILVLTATQKYEDMVKMINGYKNIKIDGIIITKMDETDQFGFIINLANEVGLPISYVTNGQNTAGHLMRFSIDNYIKNVLKNV